MAMTAPVVSAIFLFNNRFERNIPVLERIYGDRFARRTYIMPFATIDQPNVVRVQEAGWFFHGHLAQAADRILDDMVTHYVVISDDLFLNPTINESNILDRLNIGNQAAWIQALASADEQRYRFPWAADGAFQMQRATGGDLWHDLPPADAAKRRFEAMGLAFPRPIPRNLADAKFFGWSLPRMSSSIWLHALGMMGRPSPYPLLMSYADFLVLPAHSIRKFLDLCGLFAAMNLFVELAIPTALALAYDEIVTELEIGQNFIAPSPVRRPDAPLKTVNFVDEAAFGERFGWSEQRLMAEFPQNLLYVHPVKFSRWKMHATGEAVR